MTLTELTRMGFVSIGKYEKVGNKRYRFTLEDKSINKKNRTIVYLLYAKDEVFYIGRTKRGIGRATRYLQNNEMKRVQCGIKEKLEEDCSVGLWICEFEDNFDLKIGSVSLRLNPYESIETKLIELFKPKWNEKTANKDC